MTRVDNSESIWLPRFFRRAPFLEDATFAQAMLNQGVIWVDARGNVHEIEAMDPEYALNVLCFLHDNRLNLFYLIGDEASYTTLTDALRRRILEPTYDLHVNFAPTTFFGRLRLLLGFG